MDARIQLDDGPRRARRAELLPQRDGHRRPRADDEHRHRHSRREPRRLHERHLADQHRRLLGSVARILRQSAVGSLREDLEHRDDADAADGHAHTEVRRRVAEQQATCCCRRRTPAARAAASLSTASGTGLPGESNTLTGIANSFASFLLDWPPTCTRDLKVVRRARHAALGDFRIRPRQVAGALERHGGSRAAMGVLRPARRASKDRARWRTTIRRRNTIRVAGYGDTDQRSTCRRRSRTSRRAPACPGGSTTRRSCAAGTARARFRSRTIAMRSTTRSSRTTRARRRTISSAPASMAAGFPAPALLDDPAGRHHPDRRHAAATRRSTSFPPSCTKGRCTPGTSRSSGSCRTSSPRTVAYVGNRGVDLVMDVDTNASLIYGSGNNGRPQFAQFNRTGTSRTRTNDGKSRYHGLQVKVDRRFRNGLMITNSYTLSRSMDYVNENTSIGTPIDFELSWGRSNFDRRHNYALSAIYELPFGAGQTVAERTASPATDPRRLAGQRALRRAVGHAAHDYRQRRRCSTRQGTPRSRISTASTRCSAASDPASCTSIRPRIRCRAGAQQGNMRRNSGPEGPGFWQLDVSLFKRFQFGTSGRYAEFRVDAFNVTNPFAGAIPTPASARPPATRSARSPDSQDRRRNGSSDLEGASPSDKNIEVMEEMEAWRRASCPP